MKNSEMGPQQGQLSPLLGQKTYDARTEARHRGSDAVAVGWTLLAMAMLVGVFDFQDIREGTHFPIAYTGVMAFIGIMAVGYGQHVRHAK